MVTKIKQAKSQPCDCKNKAKQINKKLSDLEDKYNIQKIQLNSKERKIIKLMVKNEKLVKQNEKLLKQMPDLNKNTKQREYIEFSD